MKRRPPAPLLVAAACLAIGSVAARATEIDATTDPGIGIISTFALIAGIWFYRRHPLRRSAAIGLLLIDLSFYNASFRMHFGQTHLGGHLIPTKNGRGAEVIAKGQITSPISTKPRRISFEMGKLCLQWSSSCLPLSGKLRITIPTTDHDIGEGDGVAVEGLLRPPPVKRNPADFDIAAWLASNEVSGTLTRAQILSWQRSENEYYRLVTHVRTSIRRAIRFAIPRRSRDLPEALLLGDRSHLDRSTRNDFARGGLMHLLAISGLHVLFVGMMLHRLLRPVLMRMRCSWPVVESVRSVATLTVLTLYALVSGASPSVTRAVIMTGFLLTGTITRGVSGPLNAFGGAAFTILLFDPLALFNVGFQLSFAAVAGLLMMGHGSDANLLKRFRRPLLRRVVSGVSVSLVATLATAPILIHRFGYVGLAGVILNLVAIPIAGALLCACILTFLTASWCISLALPFGAAVDFLSNLLKYLARLGGALDLLVVSTEFTAALGATCILGLLVFVSPQGSAIRRWAGFLALSVPAIVLLFALAHHKYSPKVKVVFLDVGHGDAAIIQLPDQRTVLLDFGNRHRYRDEGRETVLPNLDFFHVKSIDLAVISHPHSDHLGGLPAVLRQKSVASVADNGQLSNTALYAEALRLIHASGRSHLSLLAGDTLNFGPLVRIFVLAPEPLQTITDTNDRSIVLKLVFGKTSFLFTGDVERAAENLLVRQYCDLLASDVIKVPHHGSRTSSTQGFVACSSRTATKPIAIVSVGSPEKYGLPDEEVIRRWKNAASMVATTFQHGAVWLESDGVNVREIDWH